MNTDWTDYHRCFSDSFGPPRFKVAFLWVRTDAMFGEEI
jgi:hypothetical protein